MILIVVLSLLTLFAIVGITFVLVADSHALSSKLAREAETTFRPDMDPEAAFSMFLGQLVYDVEDDERGIYSGLRSHSFARTMYGYNDAEVAGNDKAFSGVGRPRIPGPILNGPPLANIVNFTYFSTDGFLLDPERTAWRTSPSQTKQGAYLSAAVPYTYPDQHSFFLAMQKPSDGSILVPSFHRPFLFGNLANTNPNWTNVAGKYLTVRPRPAEHPGFPYPEDLGGDVKNMIGAPGGNDSIWIDIGAPVMTSADGRKYKMLFAPLILDLDNRINLNVHGNLRAGGSPGTTHASHQGWGKWEVNPARVLLNNELRNLIQGTPNTGNARMGGRYGSDRQPGVTGSLAAGGTSPRPWGPVDFDAIDDGTGSLAQRFLLPGENTTLVYQTYPSFNAAFGNGSVAERTDHPLLYNPFRPYNDDRGFAASNLAALLRRGDTGGQGLTSELARLLPTTIADTRRRNLLTTHSYDIDRPGATPYIWDRTEPTASYAWNAVNQYPIAGAPFAQPFDALVANRNATPPVPQSEFTTNWHSQLASLLRVNLNRPLASYPLPDATGTITDTVAYDAAWSDRILLCQDLFDRLWRVTGAPNPATVLPGTPEFRTLRWLAQLAVNMVDYIDQDDYMTLFSWYQGPPAEWVVGTETPGLVINEVFAQYENLPNDQGLQNRGAAVPPRPRAEDGFRINTWVELYNPRVPTAENPTGATRLIYPAVGPQPARPVYQLSINNWAAAANGRGMLGHPDNAYGDPTFVGMNPATVQPATPPSIVQDWPDTVAIPGEVRAGGTLFNDPDRGPTNGNDGFYVVGPPATYLNEPGIDPNLPVTHRSANMTYQLPLPRNGGSWLERRPVVLLRRLVCPHLPPGGNNPYITVDTFLYPEAPWEANPFLEDDAPNSRNPNLVPVEMRRAYGRYQPFGGSELQLQNPTPALVGQSQHAFYQHNYELTTAPNIGDPSVTLKTAGFDWLTHLDRQVVSPIELLHVSAWKPHQLTEKFVQAGVPHRHTAAWYEQATRLHRFLEFVQTAPRERGASPGGRIPGRININTLTDIDVWRALCDVQLANRYHDATTPDLNVDAAFQRLMNYRSPDASLDPTTRLLTAWPVSSPGKPFWSLAQGAATGGDQLTVGARGIENTLLAAIAGGDATSPRLLDPFAGGGAVGAIHPYQNLELLNKIFNNVTTRSNVFGVWVTVGYFEVRDENRRPVELGAEIGRSEGRHIRHRFFSIVDRTKMEAIRFNGQLTADVTGNSGQRAYADFGAGPVTTTNPETGKTWSLPDGAILTFNPDTDTQETAAVFYNTGTTTFQAEVNPYRLGTPPQTLYSATGTIPIIQYGNPGPWRRYDPKKDPCVLYFSLID